MQKRFIYSTVIFLSAALGAMGAAVHAEAPEPRERITLAPMEVFADAAPEEEAEPSLKDEDFTLSAGQPTVRPEIDPAVLAAIEMDRNEFVPPVRNTYVTSGYGDRIHPITKKRSPHHGFDYGAENTHSLAAEDGSVIFTGWRGGYGKTVVVEHKHGMVTLYAHHKSLNVEVGDYVFQGEKLGVIGKTGSATGAHLHFEVRELTRNGRLGRSVNPAEVLVRKGEQVARAP